MPPARSLPTVLDLVNPVAPRAILVGDPGRALTIAQRLLARPPLMSNHRRGLWGYTGTATDGAALTVQATGVGGGSAAPVVRELAEAGVTRMVRAGSALAVAAAAAPVGSVPLGVVGAALARDGVSRALGATADRPLRPDPALSDRIARVVERRLTVVSVDLLPQDGGGSPDPVADADALDRQTAAFLVAADRWGVTAAAVLALPPAEDDEAGRERWWHALGDAAGAAYGLTAQPPAPTLGVSASGPR